MADDNACDEIMRGLVFARTVSCGPADVMADRTISAAEMRRMIESWPTPDPLSGPADPREPPTTGKGGWERMTTAAKLVQAHIVKGPGYCGGKATIDQTRIRVNNVVFLHKMGKTVEEIRLEYPGLNLAQIHAALAYYYDNQGEIEAELVEDEGWEEEHERRKAEHLAGRAAR